VDRSLGNAIVKMNARAVVAGACRVAVQHAGDVLNLAARAAATGGRAFATVGRGTVAARKTWVAREPASAARAVHRVATGRIHDPGRVGAPNVDGVASDRLVGNSVDALALISRSVGGPGIRDRRIGWRDARVARIWIDSGASAGSRRARCTCGDRATRT